MGINHLETGIRLSQQWNFPPILQKCVALHHSPWPPALDETPDDATRIKQLLAIVRVSNSASRLLESEQPRAEGLEGENSASQLDFQAVRRLTEQVDNLMEGLGTN